VRLMRALAIVAVALTVSGATSFAQTDRNAAELPQSSQIDAAAMMLRPSDLDEPNLTLGYGEQWTNEELAAQMEESGFGRADDLLAHFVEQGSLQYYYQIICIEDEDGKVLGEIKPAVQEFSTAEGARRGYAYMMDRYASDPANVLREEIEPNLGDESNVWTWSDDVVEAVRGVAFEADVMFLYDRFVLELTLRDNTGEEPEIDDAIEYARQTLDRFKSLEGTEQPGLGLKVLRVLDGVARTLTTPDVYFRLHGVDERRRAETPDNQAGRLAAYQNAENVYHFFYELPGDVQYHVRLYQFATEPDAAAALTPEDLLNSVFFQDVTPVASDLSVDGEAMVVSFSSIDSSGEVTDTGYAYLGRIGNLVLRVSLANQAADVPQGAVERLAEQQLACLTSPGPCAPIVYIDEVIAA
jgi:hypothetical protein